MRVAVLGAVVVVVLAAVGCGDRTTPPRGGAFNSVVEASDASGGSPAAGGGAASHPPVPLRDDATPIVCTAFPAKTGHPLFRPRKAPAKAGRSMCYLDTGSLTWPVPTGGVLYLPDGLAWATATVEGSLADGALFLRENFVPRSSTLPAYPTSAQAQVRHAVVRGHPADVTGVHGMAVFVEWIELDRGSAIDFTLMGNYMPSQMVAVANSIAPDVAA